MPLDACCNVLVPRTPDHRRALATGVEWSSRRTPTMRRFAPESKATQRAGSAVLAPAFSGNRRVATSPALQLSGANHPASRFGHDLSQVPSMADARPLLREVASGSASSLPYRAEMESSFGEDFSQVKAYLGRSGAMDRLNARAATWGEQVAFGGASPDKRLVAHELTHIVQQRRSGGMQPKTQLSRAEDPAEREADSLASHAAAGQRVIVSAAPSSAVQRDIKDKKLPVPLGNFEIDMTKAEVKGGMTGEEGNVSFTPNDKAPDSKSIRLSQAAKTFDVDKKADFTFQQ